jgi:dimethylglycine catabolism B
VTGGGLRGPADLPGLAGLPGLADVRADAEHCSYCPKLCRFACPVAVATGRESVTPWGIDRAIVAATDGTVTAATAASVYACTGCRGCGSACLPGLDLPTHVRAARAAVVEAGHAPAAIEDAAGAPAAPDDALVANATAGAPTVVLAGCQSADGGDLARVLAATGVAYDVVRVPVCCGARAVDVGLADDGLGRLEVLQALLVAAETVVVADPHCARWLQVDGGDARVVTLPAWLAAHVDRLAFPAEAEPVAWHDPCWLGRGLGVYDEPRAVVAAAAGATPSEAIWHHDHARCTGAGMGYEAVDPDGAAVIAATRAAELAATGASVTVTACPSAAARLRAAGLEALDLPVYLSRRLAHAADGPARADASEPT